MDRTIIFYSVREYKVRFAIDMKIHTVLIVADNGTTADFRRGLSTRTIELST